MTKHIFESNNKTAFTIIEVLISISILVLIFIFLYGQFNLAQMSTRKTTQLEKEYSKRSKIIELIYNDFINSPDINPTKRKLYDRIIQPFSTSNSLYGIEKPYVQYIVLHAEEGKQLVRLESTNQNMAIDNVVSDFYLDPILDNITMFKVLTSSEYIEVYIQAKDMKDIYLKLRRLL